MTPTQVQVDEALAVLRAAGWRVQTQTGFGKLLDFGLGGSVLMHAYGGQPDAEGAEHFETVLCHRPWLKVERPAAPVQDAAAVGGAL